MNGGSKAVVVVHKHVGVFISKSKEDALCTKNMVSGESVYGEKCASVQAPGTRVLYLGAASSTIVSHMSDIQNPSLS
uniref:Uncharacterized protein n=1 Tax=Zea mays TaxID=4577 RepID=A0A804P2V4_MAIZE